MNEYSEMWTQIDKLMDDYNVLKDNYVKYRDMEDNDKARFERLIASMRNLMTDRVVISLLLDSDFSDEQILGLGFRQVDLDIMKTELFVKPQLDIESCIS